LYAFPPPDLDEQDYNMPTFARFLASPTRASMISSKILAQADLLAEMEAIQVLRRPDQSTSTQKNNENRPSWTEKPQKQVLAHTVGKFASSDVTRTTLYPTQKMVSNDNAKPIAPPADKKGKTVAIQDRDADRIREMMASMNVLSGAPSQLPKDKKHKKGKKNVKQRTKWTADDY
jgi:hypothetical protein